MPYFQSRMTHLVPFECRHIVSYFLVSRLAKSYLSFEVQDGEDGDAQRQCQSSSFGGLGHEVLVWSQSITHTGMLKERPGRAHWEA